MTIELPWLAVGAVVAGIISGILGGLFGIGGGAIIVPVLFEAFELLGVPEAVRMQLCIGTSLAIIVPIAIRSYQQHKAQGAVLSDVLRLWMIPSVIGVTVGAALAALAPPETFKIAFVAIAVAIAAKLMFGGDRWVLAKELPGTMALNVYGFAIGLGSSLMGIAGGSLAVMVLTLYGKPIRSAVATGAGVGVPITVAGTIGYVLAGLPHQSALPPLSTGFVSIPGVLLIAPLSSWVAPFGARLAHKLQQRTLEIAFSFYLLLAASRFIASMIG
ncbi:MAG TPA: sulfite exporter TauE/SafE family protein [Stellaceae bacterium]|jgi:uncharacterized membrane protein YfcA|nr:sulfite exporter TauE/SafE family protein [Stellaceae bacterium]